MSPFLPTLTLKLLKKKRSVLNRLIACLKTSTTTSNNNRSTFPAEALLLEKPPQQDGSEGSSTTGGGDASTLTAASASSSSARAPMGVQEEQLIATAFYRLGMTCQREAVDSRLALLSGPGQSFLSRQRQPAPRKPMNMSYAKK